MAKPMGIIKSIFNLIRRRMKLWRTAALQALKEFCMKTKHNANNNVQSFEVQVTELGTASALTLGNPGRGAEGPLPMVGPWGYTEATSQVTELGAATELTLGAMGNRTEGMLGGRF